MNCKIILYIRLIITLFNKLKSFSFLGLFFSNQLKKHCFQKVYSTQESYSVNMDGYTQTTGDDNTTYFDHLLYLCNWDELFFTCNEPHTVIIEKIESFLIEELNCSIEYVRTNGSDSTEIKGISVSKYSIYKLVLYQNQFKKKKFHLTYIVDFEPIFSDNQ